MANNQSEAKARLAAPGSQIPNGANAGREAGARPRAAGAGTAPTLEGYTPLVRWHPPEPEDEQQTRQWPAQPDGIVPAHVRASNQAFETAPIPVQQPEAAPPRWMNETAALPIQQPETHPPRGGAETTVIPIPGPGAPAARRRYDTAPIPIPPPAAPGPRMAPVPRDIPSRQPAAPATRKAPAPILLRLAYLLGCLLVLWGAWAVAPGGPLAAIFATPTPVAGTPPLQLPHSLLGAPPTPAPATPLPSPQAAPAAAPSSGESPLPPPAGVPPIEGGKSLKVEDTRFAGGEIPPQGLYRGRSARVLPAPTLEQPQRNELRIEFDLNLAAEGPVRRATLTLAGMDAPDEARSPILLTLNDRQIYTGPSPLEDDSASGGDADANWSAHTWGLDPALLRQGPNQLVLANLAGAGAENFIVIDFAEITWAP